MSGKQKMYCLRISNYTNVNITSLSEEDYYKLICCHSIIHEIGHILFDKYLRKNESSKTDSLQRYKEEKLVIEFAASYWNTFGNIKFINHIEKLNESLFGFHKIELVNNTNFELFEIESLEYSYLIDWFERNARVTYGKLGFCNICKRKEKKLVYNLFQTLYLKKCNESYRNFSEVAYELTGLNPKSTLSCIELVYEFNMDTPIRVIEDAKYILQGYGIELPEIRLDVVNEYGINGIEIKDSNILEIECRETQTVI